MTPKNAKTAGVFACLIGVLIMVAAARHAGVPRWMAPVGVGVIVAGWGFFAYSIVKNIRLARSRAREPAAGENG